MNTSTIHRVLLTAGLLGSTWGCRAAPASPGEDVGERTSTTGEDDEVETSDETSDGVAETSDTSGFIPDPATGTSTAAQDDAAESSSGAPVPPTSGDDGTMGEHAGSGDALEALRAWLALPHGNRSPLTDEPFAAVALTRGDAQIAAELLWSDRAAFIASSRQAEVEAKAIELDGFVLRYETVLLGAAPANGRSLFISMHGGGSAPSETNDEQWRNQVALAEGYMPEDAVWVAPRAPTDDWNMWFQDHIDPMFDRLITDMIVFEDIDPDRVYLNGYSAGGDGVYQLAPRMADRFAAAGMSAGHPNDASPFNLRNLAFAIHVGGDDTAFSRNEIALEWGAMLDALQLADPQGYSHQVEVHAGLPHWMNLADQVSIPFLQSFTRDLAPAKVVWLQPSRTQARFYWLAVAAAEEAPRAQIVASIEGQTVHIESTDVREVSVRFSERMLDLDQPVAVTVNGVPAEPTLVARTIAVLGQTLDEREDPAAMYAGELTVQIP